MSLLDTLKQGVGGYLLGGPIGAGLSIAGSLLTGPRKLNGSTGRAASGTLSSLPVLPGAGAVPTLISMGAGAVGGYLAGNGMPRKKRRRSKGITASELKGFKRVACILSDYQKVKVQKNVKCAPRRRSSTCK